MSTSLILVVYFVYFIIVSTPLDLKETEEKWKNKTKQNPNPTISTFIKMIVVVV